MLIATFVALIGLCTAGAPPAAVAEFIYSYNTVFDANATDHIVSTSNVIRYDEGPGWAAFWAPTRGNVDGILIQRFAFPAIPSAVRLSFNIYSDLTVNTGYSRVDASPNGLDWTTLTERPFGTLPQGVTYFQDTLSSSLVTTTELWLRTTLRTEGPLADYDPKFGQFSRSPSPQDSPSTPVFRLEATIVPEIDPASAGSVLALLAGMLFLLDHRKRGTATWSSLVIVILAASVMSAEADAGTTTFAYSYTDPFASNAEDYLISQTNTQKVNEGLVHYYCPAANGTPASLRYRFDFGGTATAAHLFAHLASYNFGGGNTGFGSLWGSKDGLAWELLLDAPTPNRIDSGYFFDDFLPASLLGSSSIWIEARMQTSGWNIMSQFSRIDVRIPVNIFSFSATIDTSAGAATSSVPEIDPTSAGSVLAFLAGAFGLIERQRPRPSAPQRRSRPARAA